MSTRALAFALVLAVAACTSMTAPSIAGPNMPVAVPAPLDGGAGTRTFLGAFSEECVRATAAGGETYGVGQRIWEIAETRHPRGLVVLSYATRPSGGIATLAPRLAFLQSSGGALVRVGSTVPPLSNANCDDTSGGGPSDETPQLKLDLANYRLTERENAIGLRLTCHNAFPAGEGSETRLYLFRAGPNQLSEVFDEAVASASIQRGPNDTFESQALVIVLKHETKGVYDLLVRRTTTVEPLTPSPGRRAETRVETTIFSWAGQHFRKN